MSHQVRPAVERMHPPQALWDHLVNPVMRTILRTPAHRLVDTHLMLLDVRGRRTGTRYLVPVGYHWIDGRLCVLTNAGWRANFRGGHPVRVSLRGRWVAGTATVREDPDDVAAVYAGLIDEMGWQRAGRRLGVRINVDRAPTREELRAAAQRSGLSVLEFDLDLDEVTASRSG